MFDEVVLLNKEERAFLYDLVTSVPFRTTLAGMAKSKDIQMLMNLAQKFRTEEEDATNKDN